MDILVICIDKDDDIGVKAGVKSPVIGRAACLEAAGRLGTADPEDSDTNTIFGGIQVYDQLRAEGHNVELICIAGHRELGIKSDRAIAAQLDDILLKYPTEKAVLVTDGAEDESVLPILQSRLKIESVRRVVVKQAQNLESTYYIIKQLVNDPKVAKFIFVPIGLILLIYAVTVWGGHPDWSLGAIALFVGIYLIYRGFGLDDLISTFVYNLRRAFSESKLTFVTYIISLVLAIMALIQGSLAMVDPTIVHAYFPLGPGSAGILGFAALFVDYSILWFVAALLAIVIGWIIDAYMDESDALYRYLAAPFFLIAAGLLIWGSSEYYLKMNNAKFIVPYINLDIIPVGLISFLNLGITIVMAVVVSWVGVRLANQIKQIMQYRTVEVIDF
jgi:putative membrane protein